MTGPLPVTPPSSRPPLLAIRTVPLRPTLLPPRSGEPARRTTRLRAFLLLAARLDAGIASRSRATADSVAAHPGLDPRDVATWWREGEGLVAVGSTVRLRKLDPGTGVAEYWDQLTEQATVHDEVQVPGTGLVAFGSFAFDVTSARGSTLVVPRLIIGSRDGQSWVTSIVPQEEEATGVLSDDELTSTARTAVRETRRWGASISTAPPAAVHEIPEASDWRTVVRGAINAIDAGEVEKVVAARSVHVQSRNEVSAPWLVDRLAQDYPDCWAFSVDGLVGATPELLARVRNRDVSSRVLAGTFPRSGTLGSPDDAFPSNKDHAEHDFAVVSVLEALHTVCDRVDASPQPFPLVLPNVIHLATDLHGTLRQAWRAKFPASVSLRVAQTMHPTAAVCGTPTQAAAAVIRRIEQLDRGRYSGPVGWIDAQGDGEWGIALRAAEISERDPTRLRLFAGCGIVSGSNPDAELAESEAKLVPLRGALGLI